MLRALYSNGCVTYHDIFSIVACGHYLATADVYRVTTWQWGYTAQYLHILKWITPSLSEYKEVVST
jgi:hypothetical protein